MLVTLARPHEWPPRLSPSCAFIPRLSVSDIHGMSLMNIIQAIDIFKRIIAGLEWRQKNKYPILYTLNMVQEQTSIRHSVCGAGGEN